MVLIDQVEGWFDDIARPYWICPACHVPSPTEEWEACEVDCEDCHDARRCPHCDERFDSVWGAEKLRQVNEPT